MLFETVLLIDHIKEEEIDIDYDCSHLKDFTTKRKYKKKNCKKEPSPEPIELDDPINCFICNETFKSNVAFGLHSIRHSDDGKYACHLCDYQSNSKYRTKMHLKAHEGIRKHKCDVCGKVFLGKTEGEKGEKPFQCTICGKNFSFSKYLNLHRRQMHWELITGSPPVKYDCKICKKEYRSSRALKRHSLSHNESGMNLSVLCDICGKRFISRDLLELHMRVHTGYKPHECKTCGKSFSRKDQLIEHERVHTGEKPHVCTICGRGFAQRTPLMVHLRTHTGERPYSCMSCGKGFISKGVRDTHMKKC